MSRYTAAGETLYEISEVKAVKYSIPCAVDPIADKKALLDAIVPNLQAERIVAASLDAKVFTVYLQSLDDVSSLLRLKNVKFRDMSLLVSHAVNAFTLCNVPPSFTGEDLQNILLLYGHVVHVEALPFCAGVPQYDHIIGSERRVFLKLLPDMANVDVPEKLTVHLKNNGVEKIVVYKHCVICKKDGHNYDSCSKIDSFHSQATLPESSNVAINIAFEVAKEETDVATGKDVLEQVDKLLDHNYISKKDDNKKGDTDDDDNDSVISLPSDAFEYVNNVVTLNVRPKNEVVNKSPCKRDTSFSDDEKKGAELEDSGSSSNMTSSSDSETSDSSSEDTNKKNTRTLRKRTKSSSQKSAKSKKIKFRMSSDDSEITSQD